MKVDLSKLKVGDYVWTINRGWEKVARIAINRTSRIETERSSYGLDGKLHDCDKYPSAFLEPADFFGETEPKPCEFVKDQKVLVRDTDKENWVRRRFAGMSGVAFVCYTGGSDSWSNPYGSDSWAYCIPWVEGMEEDE